MKHLHFLHQPLDAFVFMGCWNKTGCAAESAEEAVFHHMKHLDGECLLVLAGGNVYPDRLDGLKVYSE